MNVHVHDYGTMSKVTAFRNDEDMPWWLERGVCFTDLDDADVVVTGRIPTDDWLDAWRAMDVGVLIWTHEPRQDYGLAVRTIRGVRIHAMNAVLGNVYTHSLCMYGSMVKEPLVWQPRTLPEKRRILAVITNKEPTPLIAEGLDVDLWGFRRAFAYEGHRRGVLDIVGRRWSPSMCIEESWRPSPYVRKMELLKGYAFTFCAENTDLPHLVTEKIYHAIQAGCLPIYKGAGGFIDEAFPSDAMLDLRRLSLAQAFEQVENMPPLEYNGRMAALTQRWNEIHAKGEYRIARDAMLERAMKVLHTIMDERCADGDTVQPAG